MVSIFSMATAPAGANLSVDVEDITSFANSVYEAATAAVESVFHQAISRIDSVSDDITSGVGSLGDKITSVAAEVTSIVVSFGKFVTSGVGGVISEASGGVGTSISEATASTTPTKQVTGKETTFTMTRAPGSGTVTPTSVSEGKVRRREKYADGLLAAAVFAVVAFLQKEMVMCVSGWIGWWMGSKKGLKIKQSLQMSKKRGCERRWRTICISSFDQKLSVVIFEVKFCILR